MTAISIGVSLFPSLTAPPEPSAPVWNELSNPEDDAANNGIGADGANSRVDNLGYYYLDRDFTDNRLTSGLAFTAANAVGWEPNGLIVAPSREMWLARSLQADNAAWTHQNCTAGNGDAGPRPADTSKKITASTITDQPCRSYQSLTGVLTSGNSMRIVVSGCHVPRTGSDISTVGVVLDIDGSNYGRVFFDLENKVAEVVPSVTAGDVSVYRAYFEDITYYNDYVRYAAVFDIADTNTTTDATISFYWKDANDNTLTSTLDGDELNCYHFQAEISGDGTSGDWGAYAGQMIGVGGTVPTTRAADRYKWPWSGGTGTQFSVTGTDTATAGDAIQTIGTIYFEITPKVDSRWWGGYIEGFSVEDNFRAGIIGGAAEDEGGTDYLDTVRSSYAYYISDQDQDGVSGTYGGLASKAHNQPAGHPSEGVGVTADTGEDYILLEGRTYNVVLTYADTGDGNGAGYLRMFVNGVKVGEDDGFLSWGNGSNAPSPSPDWTAPGGGSNLGLVVGAAAQGAGLGFENGTGYFAIQNLQWRTVELTENQAAYLSANGRDAW